MNARSEAKVTRRVRIGILLAVLCLVATLAIPIRTWRTGRMNAPDLAFDGTSEWTLRTRVWVDTDAACGEGNRTDPDDCLALWLLAQTPRIHIAGVSTVFGNAKLDATDRTTRALVDLLWDEPNRPSVVTGAAHPIHDDRARSTPASRALSRALEQESLTLVALGPLTNIAAALRQHPGHRARIDRVVAVMGRRPGHLFHPSEGSGEGSWLGHGPIFRDFNFSMDEHGVADLLALDVPLTLVPYDAARSVEITAADLDRLAGSGAAGGWIAERSRGWLDYWRTEVDREGFYPFDVTAAAYVRSPQQFRCARVEAWVGDDPRMFLPLLRPSALLVAQGAEAAAQARTALYCPSVDEGFAATLRTWLFASDESGSTAPP